MHDTPAPAWQPLGLISLTTDFGEAGPYAGMLHAVMLSVCQELKIVDLTHALPPQDLRAAAYVLSCSWRYFPAGSVHVCVVDPGVGSERRVLAALDRGHVFLAPDNGILGAVLSDGARVRALDIERFSLPERSRTFHGRDVFSPAAAEIASCRAGPADGSTWGPLVDDWQRPALLAPPRREGSAVVGEVILVDPFGNLITNVRPGDLGAAAGSWRAEAAGRSAAIRDIYAQAAVGELLVLEGSCGYLELAVRDGDAARELGLSAGSPVRFRSLA